MARADKYILIDSFLKARTRLQPDIIQMCARTQLFCLLSRMSHLYMF